MGFLDSVQLPNQKQNGFTGGSKSGGFLDSVTLPANQQRANKLQAAQKEAANLTEQARRDNSLGGIIKNTLSDLVS